MSNSKVRWTWILLLTASIDIAVAESHPGILKLVTKPVDPTINGQYFEASEHVLRFQYVNIDIDALRLYLSSLEQLSTLVDAAPLKLSLFPDYSLVAYPGEASVHRAEFEIYSDFDDPFSSVAGGVDISVGKIDIAKFFVQIDDRFFGIGPTDQLPLHIVIEFDPNNLPPID